MLVSRVLRTGEVKGFWSVFKQFWRLFKLLIYHPCYFIRVIYRVTKMEIHRGSLVKTNIDGVSFNFDLTNLFIAYWYIGFPPEEILFYKRELKPGDVFIDVGANIGFMSAIAASAVGTGGQVHSFEPVPEYYLKLETLAKDNPNYHIVTNQCALGDTKGTIIINTKKEENIGGSTVVPGLVSEESIRERIEVPLITLDAYIKEKGITKVSVIKIDVEGFEFPVLRGAELVLRQFKPTILCEITPAAYSLLDSSVTDLFKYMSEFNYKCYALDFKSKEIDSRNFNKITDITNVVFKV